MSTQRLAPSKIEMVIWALRTKSCEKSVLQGYRSAWCLFTFRKAWQMGPVIATRATNQALRVENWAVLAQELLWWSMEMKGGKCHLGWDDCSFSPVRWLRSCGWKGHTTGKQISLKVCWSKDEKAPDERDYTINLDHVWGFGDIEVLHDLQYGGEVGPLYCTVGIYKNC